MHEAWIDRWKGLLILLVVLGHAVGAGGNLGSDAARHWLNEARMVIYSFHMPAFFFLAGFCFKSSDSAPYFNFLAKCAKRLLVPYFVFGLISIGIFAVMHGYDCWWQPFASLLQGGGWPNGEGFRFNSVLWFLPCIFVVLCCAKATALFLNVLKRGVDENLRMGIIAIFMIVLFRFYHWINWIIHLHFLPYGVDMIPWYFGYFLFGSLMKSLSLKVHAETFGKCFAGWQVKFVVCILGVAYVCLVLNNYHHSFDPHFLRGYYIRIFLAVCATMFCAFAAIALKWRWLESVGLASMGIMLIHKFPLVFVQEHVFTHIPFLTPKTPSLTMALVSTLLVTVFSAAISYYATRLIRKFAPWMIGEMRR